MNKLLSLRELSVEQIRAILELATRLERAPRSQALAGRTVGLLFMNPSLRTLASMQAAVAQLGGDAFVIQSGNGSWKLETRDGSVMDGEAAEHVKEAIPVLAGYADALAVRCFARFESLEADLEDVVMNRLASLCDKPFLNLESASAHPCQALADWKTLDDLGVPGRKSRFVLSWAYHPKPLPYAVAASALEMAVLRGMQVTVLRPEGYALPAPIMTRARELAQLTGAELDETASRREAMEAADILYVKSWAAPAYYTEPEREAELRRELKSWCVSEEWFDNARPEARLMHCLPVRRNVKIRDEVLDGRRSAVIRQAINRLHVQKALLCELLK